MLCVCLCILNGFCVCLCILNVFGCFERGIGLQVRLHVYFLFVCLQFRLIFCLSFFSYISSSIFPLFLFCLFCFTYIILHRNSHIPIYINIYKYMFWFTTKHSYLDHFADVCVCACVCLCVGTECWSRLLSKSFSAAPSSFSFCILLFRDR